LLDMGFSSSCATNMRDEYARFMRQDPPDPASDHQADRMLDVMPEGGEQLGAERAVDDAMIA